MENTQPLFTEGVRKLLQKQDLTHFNLGLYCLRYKSLQFTMSVNIDSRFVQQKPYS